MTPVVTYEIEQQLVQDILITFGAVPYMRLWRTNTGKAYGAGVVMAAIKSGSVELLKHQRPVTFNTPGTADICGIISAPPNRGRWIAIEAKMEGEKPSEDQVMWRAMIESRGGIYVLAYSVDDVRLGLHAAGVLP